MIGIIVEITITDTAKITPSTLCLSADFSLFPLISFSPLEIRLPINLIGCGSQ